MSHVLRFEDVIQLGFGEQIFFEHEFVNAPVGDEGFLGYGGALFVAKHRVERGNEADRILDVGEAAFAVGFNAGDAARVKYDGSVTQQGKAEKQVECDDRFSHVQLKFACLAGHGDRNVGADDLEADLVNDLGDHGVHFAGHDGRAGLHRGQVEFVKSATWTRREPAQIVADFGQLHCGSFHHAAYQCEFAGILRSLN